MNYAAPRTRLSDEDAELSDPIGFDEALALMSGFSAEVKTIEDEKEGFVRVTIKEICNDKERPQDFIARPGNRFFSAVTPSVGDFLLVRFPLGTYDLCEYTAFDPAYQIVASAADDKDVLFEKDGLKLVRDRTQGSKSFLIQAGSMVIKLSDDLKKIEISDGLLKKIELDATLQKIKVEMLPTLKIELDGAANKLDMINGASSIKTTVGTMDITSPLLKLNGKVWEAHTHSGVTVGTGVTGPVV